MQPVVELDNLSFTYPNGQQGLAGVSLKVYPGGRVAIVGPNGAGKSTLLLHLNGVLKGAGLVKVLGVPVSEKNLRWVRERVGIVFQDPNDQLFSPTVFEDVAFGPLNMGLSQDEVRERVHQALEWVGMGGFERRSPHQLSIGEKKRVALATVLAMSPEILALDEPTANLDPAGKWRLIKLLEELPGTMIIASHDLEMVAALCPRTVLLDEGVIVADGPTAAILGDLPLLREHGLAPPQDGKVHLLL